MRISLNRLRPFVHIKGERNKMKLTIQTEDKSENHITLHLETNSIFIAVTEDADIVAGAWLSPFEAQTIANVLLQMASKLEVPEHAKEDKSLRLETIADTIYDKPAIEKPYQAYEKTLNERIELIYDFEGHNDIHKKLMMQNGLEVLVTKEVWERESHLQLESDSASPSFMNIKLDKNADWWLVDTLPF